VTGDPAVGLALLEEELVGIDREAMAYNMPEVLLLMGDLLLAISPANAAEARALYQQALETAVERQIRMLELQVWMRFCRLAQSEDEAAEAARQLRRCYDWFTEGLETADLLAAKTLLDEVEGEA
jgi:hypothetical protein